MGNTKLQKLTNMTHPPTKCDSEYLRIYKQIECVNKFNTVPTPIPSTEEEYIANLC